jgi:Protein of unknown function (DUF3108)
MEAKVKIAIPAKNHLWVLELGGLLCLVLAWQGSNGSLQADALADPREIFPPGEKLVYQVRWNPPAWMFFLPALTAGELTFQVDPSSLDGGRPAWRITAEAVSSGTLPAITGISVKDHFESLIDPQDFCSLQMTKLLREGKRQRDVFLTFDRARGTGLYVAYDVSKNPRVQLKNQELQGLPSCVQDLISAIYQTRLRNIRLGGEYPLIICDDGVVKQVSLRVTKRESVETEAGKYWALKVETFSVFGGLFRQGGTLVVWVNDDARRIPVRFEAKVKLGRILGSIKRQSE